MFANLLAVFSMMGLLGRELDRKTIDNTNFTSGHARTYIFREVARGMGVDFHFYAFYHALDPTMHADRGMGAELNYAKAWRVVYFIPLIISAITLVVRLDVGLPVGIDLDGHRLHVGDRRTMDALIYRRRVAQIQPRGKNHHTPLPPMSVIGQTAPEHPCASSGPHGQGHDRRNSMLPGPADALTRCGTCRVSGIVLLVAGCLFQTAI